jgi:uroporphyrinogen decarboxylase
MSQRSALKAILHGETYPEVCQFEWGYWAETITRWQQEGMPSGVSPAEATGITYYHRVPVATGYYPQFEYQVLEDRAETQIVRDGHGVICEISKTTTAFPRYLKHPVESLADFEALKPRLDANAPGRYPENWPAIARGLAERDSILVMGECEISFFGWHRELMGVENLLMAYYDQPELIHAISEYHLDFLKKFYTPLLQTVDFDFIFMWEDMSFKNGSLISPALIKEFMLPYYKELIAYFKSIKDYKVLVDSDGDVRELIPLFIEAGVDGMLPFEVAAGMDIREIRKEYPEFIIAGGLDKREIAKGKAAIDRELESKLPFMFAHGRYLPGMDHHVPPEVSYADYRYYLQRTRDIYQACVGT